MDDKPGTSKDTNEQQQKDRTPKNSGGKNCCVPHCKSNSRKNPELSFHRIPKDETLKKKWIKLLKTKGLCNPNPFNVVCSAHFPGGKKTYENNIPSLLETNKSIKTRRALMKKDGKPHTDNTAKISSPELVPIGEEEPEVEKQKTIEQELKELKEMHEQLQAKYDHDMNAVKHCLFRLERFVSSDHDFKFYTGFPDYATFKAFFNYLSPECHHLNYHGSSTAPVLSEDQKKHGKQRALSPEEELFMVLSRLRCGFLGQDLAHRYGVSPSHISRIWTTWITFLCHRLRSLPIWPSGEFVDTCMPTCFKNAFPKTRVIIDCTEILIEMPTSCRSQCVTFSSYKNHNTAKGLLGIAPTGYPCFVSKLYAGRMSDKKITHDCGILDLLEEGDQIMADRGFDIADDLPAGVTLNIPAFLSGDEQLTVKDEIATRRIASVRVHVERAISRIKNYRILHQVVPLTMSQDLDKIWTVCSYLTLFLPPIIRD